MLSGAQGIVNAVLRILAAGTYWRRRIGESGRRIRLRAVVQSGNRALLALAIAALCLTAVGVFVMWR